MKQLGVKPLYIKPSEQPQPGKLLYIIRCGGDGKGDNIVRIDFNPNFSVISNRHTEK